MQILVCVGDAPQAKYTIRFAGVLARALEAAITLLHVIAPQGSQEEGTQILEQAQAMLEGLPATSRLRQGERVQEILKEVRSRPYELVAVGGPEEPWLMPRLLGTVALQVTRRAPASVLVVRGQRSALRRVLICTGGTEVSLPVIEAGGWLARRADAEATLLHVAGAVPSMYTGLPRVEETLSELLQSDTPLARHLRQGAAILARHPVRAQLQLRHGTAAEEILRAADQDDHDLIVLGASGARGRLKGWLLGDVTRQVVDHAPCPVLVMKGGLPARVSSSDD